MKNFGLLVVWCATVWLARTPSASAQATTETAAPAAPTFYVQGPPSELEQVVPMPGPAPTSFPSFDAYHQYLGWRLSVLSQREQQLRMLARPPERRRRIVLGFVGAGVGLGVAYLGVIAGAFATDDGMETRRERSVWMTVSIAGVLGMAAGLSVAIYTLARRPYRHELAEVRRDHNETAQRWRDANIERGRLSLQVSANSLGLRLQL